METNQLKEFLQENRMPVGFAVVAVAAMAAWYFRADSLAAVEAEFKSAEATLAALKSNDLSGKTLEADLAEAKSMYTKIAASSLDFDDGLSTQAFFSDLLNTQGVKFDGIPSLAAAPAAISGVKFFKGAYVIRAEGAASSLFSFAKHAEESAAKALRIDRVQLSQSTDKGVLSADIAVSSWGRRGELGPVAAASKQGVVTTALVRQQKIKEAKVALARAVSLPTVHLIGGAALSTGATTPSTGLDAAIHALKVSPATFLGQPAVRIEKIGVKREGNTFELTVDGVLTKVSVLSITADGVTFSSAGRTVKSTFNK